MNHGKEEGVGETWLLPVPSFRLRPRCLFNFHLLVCVSFSSLPHSFHLLWMGLQTPDSTLIRVEVLCVCTTGCVSYDSSSQNDIIDQLILFPLEDKELNSALQWGGNAITASVFYTNNAVRSRPNRPGP